MRSAGTILASGSRGLRGGVQAQNGSEWGWLCSGGGLGEGKRVVAVGFLVWGHWRGAVPGVALVLGFPSQGF